MDSGEIIAWRGNEFCHPTEAAFISKPVDVDGDGDGDGDASEDDGVIVASVTDVREDHKDFLLFLDARTMTEVARASFDDTIPFAAHVYWNQK
jgi:carotenoid cleavage dioxygenase-like enzyme